MWKELPPHLNFSPGNLGFFRATTRSQVPHSARGAPRKVAHRIVVTGIDQPCSSAWANCSSKSNQDSVGQEERAQALGRQWMVSDPRNGTRCSSRGPHSRSFSLLLPCPSHLLWLPLSCPLTHLLLTPPPLPFGLWRNQLLYQHWATRFSQHDYYFDWPKTGKLLWTPMG